MLIAISQPSFTIHNSNEGYSAHHR